VRGRLLLKWDLDECVFNDVRLREKLYASDLASSSRRNGKRGITRDAEIVVSTLDRDPANKRFKTSRLC